MLTHFKITNFRLLKAAELTPSNGVTLIVGNNASGKTSILEAINLAFTARSFRTHRLDQAIAENQKSFQLVAKYTDNNNIIHTLGCERRDKKLHYRYGSHAITTISHLASQIPVHLIQPETHHLLEQGPKFRRQFIDWALFHVEPNYLTLWKSYHRTLRQRNTLLRQRATSLQIQAWDEPLAVIAQELDLVRARYLKLLLPEFLLVCAEILEQQPYLTYYRGWDGSQSLLRLLKNNIKTDLQLGFTQSGCHRADLVLRIDGKNPQHYYSRGQQKLLISALRIAHYSVLIAKGMSPGVLLVDDLPAELDSNTRQRFIHAVGKSQIQTLITATEREQLKIDSWPAQKVFHVEHGVLREVL